MISLRSQSPICTAFFNPEQYIYASLLKILDPSTNPMPIYWSSANPTPTHKYKSITHPPLKYQCYTKLPIHYQYHILRIASAIAIDLASTTSTLPGFWRTFQLTSVDKHRFGLVYYYRLWSEDPSREILRRINARAHCRKFFLRSISPPDSLDSMFHFGTETFTCLKYRNGGGEEVVDKNGARPFCILLFFNLINWWQ